MVPKTILTKEGLGTHQYPNLYQDAPAALQVQDPHPVSCGDARQQQPLQPQLPDQRINQEVSAAALQQFRNAGVGGNDSGQSKSIPKPALCGSKSIVKCDFEEGPSSIEVQHLLFFLKVAFIAPISF